MSKIKEVLRLDSKQTTLAQIAVMRKLILIAHSLYTNNIPFSNELYEKNID